MRIEETAPVLAVSIHPSGSKVITSYGDNLIREWDIRQKLRNITRIIGNNTRGSIKRLGIGVCSELYALTNEEIIFFDFDDSGRIFKKGRFRIKPEYREIMPKEKFLLIVSDEDYKTSKAILIDIQERKIANSIESKKISLCECLDQKAFVLFDGKSSLSIMEGSNSTNGEKITLPVNEVTSLCSIQCQNKDEYLLACGQLNGDILMWKISLLKDNWKERLLLRRHSHDGIVSSLCFLDDSRILSGGIAEKFLFYVLYWTRTNLRGF